MAPVDLNRSPGQEEDEDCAPGEEPDQVEESGADVYLREKKERIAKFKRQRELEALAEGKKAKTTGSKTQANGASAPIITNGASSNGTESRSFELDYKGGRKGSLTIPEGWEACPPLGEPIGNLIPSKAPLGEVFKAVIEPGKRHSPEIIFNNQKKKQRNVGLVIDLTNTHRYYPPREWTNNKVLYVKLPCRGRDEVPSNETVNRFCYEVRRFNHANQTNQANLGVPLKYVLVHCTHGHNRTGYMIIHYLMRMETERTKRQPCLAEMIDRFAKCRPPGIYKDEYIQALFKEYHEMRPPAVLCPDPPAWKANTFDLNGEAKDVEDEEEGNPIVLPDAQLGQVAEEGSMSNDDILGDAIHEDHEAELQWLICHRLGCNTPKPQFPGSQPVSLARENLMLVRQQYYHVTWKADGMRYMLLLMADGAYLIDRNFRFRRIQMRFPIKVQDNSYKWNPMQMDAAPLNLKDYGPVHALALLDGEMVIDVADKTTGQQVRRYLAYDLMIEQGVSLIKDPFHQRFLKVERNIVMPRRRERDEFGARRAQKVETRLGYQYESEPFSIRRKDFWPLDKTKTLLDNFIPALSHGSDGLIFQDWDDPYVMKTHKGLLKWKFAHMNSVDFLLEEAPGGKLVLMVMDRGKPFLIEGAKVIFPEGEDPSRMVKKVIECSCNDVEKNEWAFMKIRHDKPFANALNTYKKVLASIRDNITEDVLLKEVSRVCALPMYEERNKEEARKQHRPAPPPSHHHSQQHQQQQRSPHQQRPSQPLSHSSQPPPGPHGSSQHSHRVGSNGVH
eukprot:TRINITY_DN5443_c1_g1_i1.p1 TRINITY_DN5443_c1_g1~~TRINITY_DN5443_c1_g1_i1.p1  ORF type:complete len:787 (-),score=173.00 TRINITY_DN5443_c1_g1_i1:153-2513(-)